MGRRKKPVTVEEIMLGKAAKDIARTGVQQCQQVTQQFNIWLSGVRVALNVPEGWVFDQKKLAFVPPPAKETP